MHQTAITHSRAHFIALTPLLAALAVNFFIVINQLELHYINGLFSAITRGVAIDLVMITCFWALLFILPGRKSTALVFSAGMSLALFLIIADALCFHFSLARLNTGILHDINIYAMKAVLGAGDVLVLAVLMILIGCFAWFAFKSALAFKDSVAQAPTRRHFVMALLVIMCGLAIQLVPLKQDERHAASLWNSELAEFNKNSFLNNLAAGVFVNIFNARRNSDSVPWQSYSDSERKELENMGLLPVIASQAIPVDRPFKRVVLLVNESLALDYFHSVNPDIPAAASDFLDGLMQRFPAARNYHNSSYPTLQGLIAMLCSRLPPEHHLIKTTGSRSLFQLMKQQHGARGYIITGNSRFYGGENVIFKNVLGVDDYISYEDLLHEYPAPPVNDWGFHDDVVFDKTAKIMQENRDRSYLLLAKTIDMHQPPSYCGVPSDQLPVEVAAHPSQVVRSIYWTNHCLRQFFAAVESAGLLDEETLIIITADHYPMPNYGHSDLIRGEYYLYSRLPLIFASGRAELVPDFNPDQLACQLDLAPAVCRLTATVTAPSFMGYDLLASASVPRILGFYNNVFNLEVASGAVNFPVNLSSTQYPAIARWINNTQAEHHGQVSE